MSTFIRCDMPGCDERYPVRHQAEGELGFTEGRWLGWFYLDLNRTDLATRPLRLCSAWCVRAYLDKYENRLTGPSHADRVGLTR